jgi:hypothetical protein
LVGLGKKKNAFCLQKAFSLNNINNMPESPVETNDRKPINHHQIYLKTPAQKGIRQIF